jgi:hypothetical protein
MKMDMIKNDVEVNAIFKTLKQLLVRKKNHESRLDLKFQKRKQHD